MQLSKTIGYAFFQCFSVYEMYNFFLISFDFCVDCPNNLAFQNAYLYLTVSVQLANVTLFLKAVYFPCVFISCKVMLEIAGDLDFHSVHMKTGHLVLKKVVVFLVYTYNGTEFTKDIHFTL